MRSSIQEIVVNPDFIARFERAICKDSHPAIGGIPQETVLRYSICGLASVALQEYLHAHGVTSELHLQTVTHSSITAANTLQHVFLVTEDVGHPYVIDPTFTQVLNLVGLTPYYEKLRASTFFPPHKIACFEVGQPHDSINLLGTVASHFIQQAPPVTDRFGRTIGAPDVSLQDFIEILRALWDIHSSIPYEPSPETTTAAQAIVRRLQRPILLAT